MKINWITINKIWLLALVMLAFGSMTKVEAQNNKSKEKWEQSIKAPDVSTKAARCIRSHMQAIEDWFIRRDLETKLVENGEVIELMIPCADLFYPNTAELNSIGVEKLSLLKDVVKYATMYKIVVAVHSDSTGEENYCNTLTSQRGKSIKDYLAQINTGKDLNVDFFGLGSSHPISSNDSLDGRNRNRRVEIYIVPEWQMVENAKSGRLCKK